MSALLSGIGLVFVLRAICVKPLMAATASPCAMVSRSSYPGSPKETLLSNQPCETCKFLNDICFASEKESFFPIFLMTPSIQQKVDQQMVDEVSAFTQALKDRR